MTMWKRGKGEEENEREEGKEMEHPLVGMGLIIKDSTENLD